MFKPWRVLFVAGLCCAYLTASAQTLYDNFTPKWREIQVGSGTAFRPLHNQAEFAIGGSAQGAGADFFARGLASTCVVSGDFDLRVSYRLLDWPSGNGVRMALYLGDPTRIDDESQGIFVERDSYGAADGGPREVYVFFAGADIVQEVDTSDTAGRLRVTREGSTVTGYYRTGTSWERLSSIDLGTQQDFRFSILLYSHDSVFADMPVSAAFDNAIVVKGSFKGAFCPFAANTT